MGVGVARRREERRRGREERQSWEERQRREDRREAMTRGGDETRERGTEVEAERREGERPRDVLCAAAERSRERREEKRRDETRTAWGEGRDATRRWTTATTSKTCGREQHERRPVRSGSQRERREARSEEPHAEARARERTRERREHKWRAHAV